MGDFNKAYEKTMAHEGGYVNNPNDTGGETYKGVARKHHPTWGGWKHIDAIKVKVGTSSTAINTEAAKNSELQQQVRDLYKKQYWDVNKLDSIANQLICEELFDTGVNMGTGVAAKFLREALNLCNKNGKSYSDIDVDGVIDNKTLQALSLADQKVILNTLNLLQGERYLNIMRKNKTQEIFWPGWLKRVLIV